MSSTAKEDSKGRQRILTPPFRVSFPKVFNPESYNGGKAKYSVSMVFHPKDFTPAHKARFEQMKALVEAACQEKFNKPISGVPGFRSPFRDGKVKAHLEGYGPGLIFATASTEMRPGLIDMNKQEIIDPEEFYPGCWARATITAYGYDQQGNKGVGFGLHNLQKLKDDQSFTGRVSAEDDMFDEEGEPEFFDQDEASSLEGEDFMQ